MGAAWQRFWFSPRPTSTLALFRIAFGALMVAWTATLGHDLSAFFSADGVLARQPGFGPGAWGLLEWFSSDGALVALWACLLVASIALMVGFQSRVAAVVVWLGVLSFTRRDPFVFNSGDGLVRVLAFYLMFAPAGESLSVDRWLRHPRDFWSFPARAPWALRLIQLQVSLLYLSTVWAKARGGTWNDGTAASYALRLADLQRFPAPDFLTHSSLGANLATYGTMVVELALGVLLWNRRALPWVILAGVALHLGIDVSVRVGFFSLAIFAGYVAFVPADTASRFILAVRDRARIRRRRVAARA